MDKPDKCCGMGSYEHQIPMSISGKLCYIDICVAKIVASLNAANIVTVMSCCGHGKILPTIIIQDESGDREKDKYILIMNKEKAKKTIEMFKI